MRGIKDKGMEELNSFQNRLFRQKGLQRIDNDDFERINKKLNELIELVEEVEETDEKPYL